jgi:uncharacterized membrane protein
MAGALFIEGLLIGLIGRPLLWLIKWLRWPLLFYGVMFNAVYTYNPETKAVTFERVTYVPFIIGLILFSVGLAVKRYDERYREYMRLISDIEFGRIVKEIENRQKQNDNAKKREA